MVAFKLRMVFSMVYRSPVPGEVCLGVAQSTMKKVVYPVLVTVSSALRLEYMYQVLPHE